ncbi:Plasmodium vivax Vir protein, putative [Plasmodium vivax]|uniref:Vir protein, putative n=1 Tax=Plasmodium vivax TaxID=5855 RepID=A0A1G4H0K3_PLAVI|nr:Plasmodium vivax Vir protein, putative [Plasmodium vivax]
MEKPAVAQLSVEALERSAIDLNLHARGGSTSGGSWFSSLFGSSTGSSRSGKVSSPPENPKAASAAGDKGRQEVSQGVAGTRDSPGLTSSTSLGASARPVVGAAGGGLSGQLVTTPPAVTLIPKAGEKPEQVVHATSSYSSGPGGNALPEPTASPAGALESVSDKVDSNFYRNIIMAAAILGTIFFLFYYNMSSGLKSRFPKRKRKKKIFEHNYYEEYEKELEKYVFWIEIKSSGLKSRFPKRKRKKKIFEHNYYEEYEKELEEYGSEDMSLDSEDDRYYLNYQPERNNDY